jgi:BirA family transcriptional regulator, biotin operon repressor / biotin---[acetyl-CoA-carboxylase] ligase
MSGGAGSSPFGAHLGAPRVHLRRTDSTNDRARELALAGAPHGTLVTASEQTAGRGRQGRRWSAPAGSALLMSLLLRGDPQGTSAPPPLLPLIAAVAVADVAGADARIKWPNDVVFASDAEERGGRSAGGSLAKVAGILAEGRPQEGWAVLGIGLNVAVRIDQLPPELHGTAATLGREPSEVEPVLQALLAALQARLAEPAEQILQAWRERDALRGRTVAWSGGEGRAEGVDGAGRLIVELAGGGRTTLDAGEVHLRLEG